MRRRDFLRSGLGMMAAGVWAQGTKRLRLRRSRERPNIVFILADDLGWSDLGCYGNRFHETPHLDRLAKEGMRFTNAYAAAPVCSPTRASIMSGQYPARLHLTDFIPGHRRPWARLVVPSIRKQLPLRITTLAEALKPAGYVSAHFGKWHLGGRDAFPDKQGFDAWLVTSGKHVAPFNTTPPLKVPAGTYRADVLTEQALAFIEAHRERPFFIHLSYHLVHIPLQAPPQWVAKYEAKPQPGEGIHHPTYAAMVEYLDRCVGRVLAKLAEEGLAERTLVVFFSDNGGLRRRFDGQGPLVTSNAPLRAEKGTLYEGGIRVPMLVRWPGVVEPGSECAVPVISNDFLPTFVEVADVPLPADYPHDGVSLLPLWQGSGALPRDALYWHYPHYHHSTPAGAIRKGDYKLLEFFEDGRWELYNLKEDLGEQNNLVEQEPERAQALQRQLLAWREAVGAVMPTPNPNYDPDRAHKWGRRS